MGGLLWSHDLGGFYGDAVDPELYVRWLNFGVFSAAFRVHSYRHTALEKRPFHFVPPHSAAMHDALLLRARLLPSFYSGAALAQLLHQPLLRPLYYEWPDLADVYQAEGQFLLADASCGVQALRPPPVPSDPI